MEGLQNLRYLLQEGDYMCQLDLKDACYCVLLQKISRKYVRFRWSGNLYEFLCLCFALGPTPRIFTKLLKTPISSRKYKNDYLLGRHASNGSLHRGDKHVSRHSNLLVTTSGFSNQLEKVCFDISAGDRIFGAKNQLSQPTNMSHRRENTESKNKMSKFTDRTTNFDFRINKSDWLVDINNPSSTASKITMSVSSATANVIFKGKSFISAKNNSEPPIKKRITMVDNKSRSLQWSIMLSASCTGFLQTDASTKG